MQVSAANVLLGADISLEPREAPPAFSSAPLAEIPGSAAEGAEGEGVSTAAAVDADSSLLPTALMPTAVQLHWSQGMVWRKRARRKARSPTGQQLST